jgi:hypothetical protein
MEVVPLFRVLPMPAALKSNAQGGEHALTPVSDTDLANQDAGSAIYYNYINALYAP